MKKQQFYDACEKCDIKTVTSLIKANFTVTD